jgi:hypothetical protein
MPVYLGFDNTNGVKVSEAVAARGTLIFLNDLSWLSVFTKAHRLSYKD